MYKLFLPFLLLSLMFTSCNKKLTADLIVHNATVYTVDKNFTIAQAIVVKDGKIVETGSDDLMLSKYASKEKLDASNKTIYPGISQSRNSISKQTNFYTKIISV